MCFSRNIKIDSLGDVIYYLFFNGSTIGKTFHAYKHVPDREQKTGSARSVEDCYLIAAHYFPEITYEQVENAIKSFYTETMTYNNGTKLYMLLRNWCSTVKRQVHSTMFNRNTYSPKVTKEMINEKLNSKNLNYEQIVHPFDPAEIIT